MEAGIKTVELLLHGSSVYLVPHFQRSYSWGTKQWQRLWSDLLSIEADLGTKKHFIGPLVCAPLKPHLPGDTLTPFEVIDGQQRLTTLSVLFGALRDEARKRGEADLAAQITEDYLVHHRRHDSLRYKLVPRTTDRAIWQRLVDGIESSSDPNSLIDDAWAWFASQADSHFARKGITGLKSLVHAVAQRIAFVAINIVDENPYRVFESLNTTGLALTEFDLVRNHLFMKVPVPEQEEFDRRHWREFEKLWDDCSGKDGTAGKEATLFLRQFLMRKAGHFPKGETFVQFRAWADSGSEIPAETVRILAQSARFARRFRLAEALRDRRQHGDASADWPSDSLEQRLLQLAYCDARTAMPLLLELMDRQSRGELTLEDVCACLQDVVSLLVRRSIAGEKTKHYDKKFVEIARRLEPPIRESLDRELHRLGWPSDPLVLAALATLPIYRADSAKARLILEEIERAHGHREPVKLSQLQLEHVLPQTISGADGEDWKRALGPEWETEHARLLHTIGNLTLTGYNATLSNRAFTAKRDELKKSTLQLNKTFAAALEWTPRSIEARTRQLGQRFLELFPVIGAAPSAIEQAGVDRTERADKNRAFWKRLVDRLAACDGPAYAGTPTGNAYMTASSDYRCFRMVPWIDRSGDRIGVLASFIGSEGDRVFSTVRSQRSEIESRLGMSVGEQVRVQGRSPHLRIERASAGLASTQGEAEALEWFAKQVPAFRRAVEPCLEKIDVRRSPPQIASRHTLRLAWFEALLATARLRTPLHTLCSPRPGYWVSAASSVRGLSYVYIVGTDSSRVELYFSHLAEDPAQPKRRFDWLLARKEEIESVTGPLDWDRLQDKKACRISRAVDGGYQLPREQWPRVHDELIECMIRLHRAIQPVIDSDELQAV